MKQQNIENAAPRDNKDDFYGVLGEGIRQSALLLEIGEDGFLLSTELGEAYDHLSS